MTEKSRNRDAANDVPLVLLNRGLEVKGLVALQRRGLEAMRHAAELVTEANKAILAKQASLFESYFEPRGHYSENGDASGILSEAANASRVNFESSVRSAREITDELRKCWFGIFDELEACTRESLGAIGVDRKETSRAVRKAVRER